jgi:D-glycero-D-manno-heptose 1,7-bisphosphate phosphatase
VSTQPADAHPARVVFLDRDGTINIDRGYVFRVEQFEFVAGAVEAMRRLREAGFHLAVVTNQSGIGRGYYTADDVERLHQHMRRRLELEGVAVSAVAYCPHGPQEDCPCRKPRGGMAGLVESQLRQPIDYRASWMIGDKPADVGFGVAIGVRTVLLESDYWTREEVDISPTAFAPSLEAAVEFVLKESS